MTQFLTKSEAAKYLGIASITLKKWSNKGLITHYRMGLGKHRVYKKEDLEKLCDQSFAMQVYDDGEKGLTKKGQVIQKDGLLIGINEGTAQTGIPSSLIFTGAGVISKEYFNYEPVKFTETEYGLPHKLVVISKDIPVHTIFASANEVKTAPI